MRWSALALAAMLATTVCATAHADDAETAEGLFNEGRRLMQNEDYGRACPMLAESQRLDPGLGTQFNLADCYEHVGKTATAWAIFVEVETATKATGQTARAVAAHDRAAALARKLSHLVIAVPTTHPRGLQVKKDGVIVGAMQWGIAIPVDPGSHRIEMTAPGRKPWESSIVVMPDGLTMALPVPNLDMADGTPAPPEANDTSEPTGPDETEHPVPARKPASDGFGAQGTAAIALGGVGVLGLVVGTAAGLVSLAKHNESNNGCIDNVCSPSGGAARDGAISAGNWSTAAFTVGVIAGAAGVVLWVTRPSPKATKPSSAATSVGLAPVFTGAGGGAALLGRW
jgi:hypothetical protein